ncbi:ABC transporter ATP-binding protein [Actinomadura macrotermitis]|uniref:ABC transporter ATP-binding protein YtrE n=1 Tax=Actinomadura macrotermitis TaxID=2585200 RepID=A0A7K0C2Z6_9ACTN|nr:ATP-binding cassette domain-containing protein [Actinomadura macrotermitis]MQY07793.1 ABC transporter ATP-binding protein YtrE [Actinomadura macrotermitis]
MTAALATAPLALRGVRHSYGDAEVLHGVDLTLDRGELVALLGPSGSGKTTLLAVAGGLLKPTAGEVSLLGADMTGQRLDRIARQVAYILQAGALIPYLTVQENLIARRVVTGHRPTAADQRDAARLLAAVDLAGKAGRYPDRLSGGERQRACVAQALYTGAPVLLADEPTASLDRARGRAVMELLAAHARDTGAAVLVATHDERSLDLAGRTLAIEDGVLTG